MPFTPFHGGPGLMLKALFPRGVSLVTFLTTQIVIDCETAYHLLIGDYPLHRFFHSLIGGAIAGCAVAVVVVAASRWLPISQYFDEDAGGRGEMAPVPAIVAGVVGGTSHSILDGIVHPDVRPFAPVADVSPL